MKSTEEDIDKPDFHDLGIFTEKIQTADSPSHQQHSPESANFLQPKYVPTRSQRTLEMTKNEESEYFGGNSPNIISTKMTVDVCVEFERRNNLYKSKIDDTRTNNGL